MDKITLIISAVAANESLARTVVAAYAARLNPTMEVLSDVKTAVSEAVTNAVIHAYGGEDPDKEIRITAELNGNTLKVEVSDSGIGITNITNAMKDFYTTKPSEERSGLGFTIMGSFMNTLEVRSIIGEGTTVLMTKKLI